MSIQRQTMCYNNTLNPKLPLKLAQIWSVNVTFTLYVSPQTSNQPSGKKSQQWNDTKYSAFTSYLHVVHTDERFSSPENSPVSLLCWNSLLSSLLKQLLNEWCLACSPSICFHLFLLYLECSSQSCDVRRKDQSC